MKKAILYFLVLAFFTHCRSEKELPPIGGYYHIRNDLTELALSSNGVGLVYRNDNEKVSRCILDKSVFALVSNGKEIGFTIEKALSDVTSVLGEEAQGINVYAKDNNGLGISMIIHFSVPEGYQNVLISQIEVINNSDKSLKIDTLISNRYTLQSLKGDVMKGQAPFWAFCGGNYVERFDWIEPMEDGFYRENDMAPTGGNPFTDIWNPEYGIAIMSLDLNQQPLAFPVRREADNKVEICIKELVKKDLKSGEHWNSTLHALLTHKGDMYNGLATWSKLLQDRGLHFQQSPASCYESVWCGWGYEDNYTSDELLSTLPMAKEMGIKWAVVDAGWYDRDTFWELNSEKYPKGDASMRAFTDSVKALGMRPKLWFIPATAPYGWPEGRRGKKGPLIVPDNNMLLLDENGNTVDLDWFGVSILCPTQQSVIDVNKAFVRKAMKVWGFDGFKIDGEYLNMFPPCYNPAHKHKDPFESVYAGSKLLKAMYDEAISIVPDAVFEICACGTNYSIYNMQAQNQTVSSDPLSSWQVRHRGKVYRALLNSKIAYYGDHVELSDGKNDFASTIGVGGVPGTKFTLVETRKMEEGSKLLTPENKKLWKKYFTVYEKEKPSEGHYLNLYDIAYDTPEMHVLQKGSVLYYGIFTKGNFKGKITLKGLSPNVKYQVIDYVEGKVLYSNISSENNGIDIEIDNSLLLKAVPMP